MSLKKAFNGAKVRETFKNLAGILLADEKGYFTLILHISSLFLCLKYALCSKSYSLFFSSLGI